MSEDCGSLSAASYPSLLPYLGLGKRAKMLVLVRLFSSWSNFLSGKLGVSF